MQRGRPKKENKANIVVNNDIVKTIKIEMLGTNLRIFGKRLVAGCIYDLTQDEYNEIKEYETYYKIKEI
jgi:hypothetical protein